MTSLESANQLIVILKELGLFLQNNPIESLFDLNDDPTLCFKPVKIDNS